MVLFRVIVILLALALLLSLFVVEGSRHDTIKLTIPYPSGIQVDTVEDAKGQKFRFGRLQHNSITIRPAWSTINIVENVFSQAECSDIVKQAENYAEKFGWSKGRHVDYDIRPTQDLPVDIIYSDPLALRDLYDRFASRIWPAMAKEFQLDPKLIRPTDLFITKYNSSHNENMLGPHQDKSLFSFVIPLNADFDGGGTYFFDTETLWVPPLGGALFFSGNQLHGGSPTTKGVRYILAGFCEYGAVDYSADVSSDAAHTHFMSFYDPTYDGTAAQAGFRSGDLIVSLEVCEKVSGSCNTTGSTNSGDSGSGGELNEEQCVLATPDTPLFSRRKVEITGLTTDEEWVTYAQSCEELDPQRETVMWVRRRKSRRGRK